MPTLIKYHAGAVKALDEAEGLVTAYAAAFGNRDQDGDVIHRGAFAKTIRERGPAGSGQIKMLYMHRFDEPIGKVLHLEEDEHGLLFQARLVDTQRGRDALTLYKEDLFEHSVGIDVVQPADFRGGDITEARLWDVSPVTWGANPATPTLSVKSMQDPDYLPGQVRRLRKALRTGISDETAKDLEMALALLEAQVAQLCKHRAQDPADVWQGVLREIKASPSAPTAKGADPVTPQEHGPHRSAERSGSASEDEWLRAVLTNLKSDHV